MPLSAAVYRARDSGATPRKFMVVVAAATVDVDVDVIVVANSNNAIIECRT